MRPTFATVLPHFRRGLAFVLDLYTSLIGCAYFFAFARGSVRNGTVSGADVVGAVALAIFLGYFAIAARTSGTPWQRLLRARSELAGG